MLIILFRDIIKPEANVPENFESYHCAENEAKTIRPLHDVSTGEFKGLKKYLASTTLEVIRKYYFLTMSTIRKSPKLFMQLRKE